MEQKLCNPIIIDLVRAAANYSGYRILCEQRHLTFSPYNVELGKYIHG